MPSDNKCTAELPQIRISERLEQALNRLAARDDRKLSDYVRLILERHAFGHASSVTEDPASCQQCNAVHSGARKKD